MKLPRVLLMAALVLPALFGACAGKGDPCAGRFDDDYLFAEIHDLDPFEWASLNYDACKLEYTGVDPRLRCTANMAYMTPWKASETYEEYSARTNPDIRVRDPGVVACPPLTH